MVWPNDQRARSMKSETRRVIKSVLGPLGLLGVARSVRDRVVELNDRRVLAKNRDLSEFTAELEGISLRFSLDDPYSRDWFLPRYAGGKLHEKAVTLLMAHHLKQSSCFVDVGTNLGWFTCLASKLIPHGRVYGFEMDDKNFALVQRNLALNHCENAQVQHAAVSDAAGMVTYVREDDSPSSVLRMSQDASANESDTVSIHSVCLDEFFADEPARPDLMKIDVEGAEMKVLHGMKGLLERDAPTLFVEIHPADLPGFGSSSAEVLSFLADHGYSASEILDLRKQSDTRLRTIEPGTSIDHNCMIFARRE